MTQPPNLLSATDFAKFRAKDQDWFLGAAGEVIRDYCEWHIYPVQADTDVSCKTGAKGIIMLPSLNVKSVETVRFRGITLSSDEYTVHDSGWLEWHRFRCWANPVPMSHPTHAPQHLWVSVDFTHGYDTLPKAVAEVGYELTARTMEKPAGVVNRMQRGYVNMSFNEFGAVLSRDQKNRLGPYCVMDF